MDQAVRYNRFLLDQILRWAGGKRVILDFGAGNGRFAIAVHQAGIGVHAIEADPGLREKISAGDVVAHAGFAALANREFDGIYTLNVLEHIEDDDAVLSEFHEHLRAGGGLLVYVPAFALLFSSNDVRVGHVRRYRRRPLVAQLERAGFIVDDARYVDSIGFAAGLAYRFLGDREGDLDLRAVRFYDAVLFPISRVLDRVLDRFLGKNLLILAHKPAAAEHAA
jgi:SAM-dependent methyltransferase